MFDRLLRDLAQALDDAGIPYMVIGGQAVLAYGEYRFTRDIDITLGVDTDQLPVVLSVVEQVGLSQLVDSETFVPDYLILPCVENESGIRVDLSFRFSGFGGGATRRNDGFWGLLAIDWAAMRSSGCGARDVSAAEAAAAPVS